MTDSEHAQDDRRQQALSAAARRRPGKLTVTAATHVNTLGRWLGITWPYSGHTAPPTETQARDAFTVLADMAANGLGAGIRGSDVTRDWPVGPERLSARRQAELDGRALDQIAKLLTDERTFIEAVDTLDAIGEAVARTDRIVGTDAAAPAPWASTARVRTPEAAPKDPTG
jgi:hypothetical protein